MNSTVWNIFKPILEIILGISRKYYYIFLFFIFTFIFIFSSMLFFDRYSAVNKEADQSIQQYGILRQHRIILNDLLDMETGSRGYLLTADVRFLEPYQQANKKLDDDIAELRKIISNDATGNDATGNAATGLARIEVWAPKIRDLRKSIEAGIAYRRKYPHEAVPTSYVKKQKAVMDDLRRYFDISIQNYMADLRTNQSQSEVKKGDLTFSMIIANVLIIGLMLLTTIIIYQLESESERAAKRALKAEQMHRTIMEGVNDGIFEYTPGNDNFYMSPTGKIMLGYSDAEIDNSLSAFADLLHPEDKDHVLAALSRYATSGSGDYTLTYRMLSKDRRFRWILARGVGVRDETNTIKSLIGTHSDITDQKQFEEQLRQVNADLETFTYITSHDLRSPLVNLRGFSNELEMSLKTLAEVFERNKQGFSPEDQTTTTKALKEDIPEALGFIGYSVARMDTLTKAILDLSRIGKYVYHFEAIPTGSIIEKCLGAQAFQINEKKVIVECGPMPTVTTDSLALEQIFANLIDNAIKYLSPGRPGRLSITCDEILTDYLFVFVDNGRGIHPSDQDKIFEIFRRARNTGDVQGQGLGMAYVRATLRKLGGSISLESQLDVGTTFYVRVPKIPPKPDSLTLRPTGARATTEDSGGTPSETKAIV
jgi:PAS domain S-box-containing protein